MTIVYIIVIMGHPPEKCPVFPRVSQAAIPPMKNRVTRVTPVPVKHFARQEGEPPLADAPAHLIPARRKAPAWTGGRIVGICRS